MEEDPEHVEEWIVRDLRVSDDLLWEFPAG
jgi:hypothetical protein